MALGEWVDLACEIFQLIQTSRSSVAALWMVEQLHEIDRKCELFQRKNYKIKPLPEETEQILKYFRISLNEAEIEAIGGKDSLWINPFLCIELFVFCNRYTSIPIREHLNCKYQNDNNFHQRAGCIFANSLLDSPKSSLDLILYDLERKSPQNPTKYLEELKFSPIKTQIYNVLKDCPNIQRNLLEAFFYDPEDLMNLEVLWQINPIERVYKFLLSFLPKILVFVFYEQAEKFNELFRNVIKFAWRAKNCDRSGVEFCAKLKQSLAIDEQVLNSLP